jgi:hypothetical protein
VLMDSRVRSASHRQSIITDVQHDVRAGPFINYNTFVFASFVYQTSSAD